MWCNFTGLFKLYYWIFSFLNFACLILLKEFQLKKVESRNVEIKLEQFQVGFYTTPSILINVNIYSP